VPLPRWPAMQAGDAGSKCQSCFLRRNSMTTNFVEKCFQAPVLMLPLIL
jgi:hypothetical protein